MPFLLPPWKSVLDYIYCNGKSDLVTRRPPLLPVQPLCPTWRITSGTRSQTKGPERITSPELAAARNLEVVLLYTSGGLWPRQALHTRDSPSGHVFVPYARRTSERLCDLISRLDVLENPAVFFFFLTPVDPGRETCSSMPAQPVFEYPRAADRSSPGSCSLRWGGTSERAPLSPSHLHPTPCLVPQKYSRHYDGTICSLDIGIAS